MKRVLVSGASGFIGGNVVKRNLKTSNRVRALVLPNDPGADRLSAMGVDVVLGNVCDYESVRKAMDGVELVFHCAAVVSDWAPKKLFEEVTVNGTRNMCRAASEVGVSRFVAISTCDVFGVDESVVMDESLPLRPWNEPYPDHKIKAEEVMWAFYREKKLPVTMVYPCWVYGAGDQTFVPLLADAIIKRDLVFWRRDALVWPTYIDNLVDLLMLISADPRAVGNGFLVHDGESTTLQAFCAEIARGVGAQPITTHVPYWLAYAASWVMELMWMALRIESRPLLTTYSVKNLGSRFRFSIEKARRELGWTPRLSHREGMELAMKWLQTLDLKALKQK